MIELIKGDTDKIKITVYSDGRIKDLTGFSGKLIIKHNEQSEDVVAEMDHHGDSDLDAGVLIFNITKEISANLKPGQHRYQVKIENSDTIKTVLNDKIIVSRSL